MRLHQLQATIRGEPQRISNSNFEFYKVIITPRKEWPDPKYGWLGGSQMNSAMHMFHKSDKKKWFINIDHLYVCHFVKGDHWVALDINLPVGKIDVYDIIYNHCDDKTITESCRPFSRMIPALLNSLVPYNIRKKSVKQFTVCRKKGIPQNDNPGDCGVYTLKYIECLALGCTFDSLSDKNIPQIV